jgi:hypothetical protein
MKSLWFGVISAVAVLVMLLKFLSGAPSNASLLESLSPVEAVKNLVFALGFGAGLPTTVAVIAAALHRRRDTGCNVLVGTPLYAPH